MAIDKIKVVNFKSFKELEIKLGNFNVLIGANASGKSNFVQFFRFLRDITEFGLDNAISLQGGVEYLRNIKLGWTENLMINVISEQKFKRAVRKSKKDLFGIKICETNYEFVIKFKQRGPGFEIIKDKSIQKMEFLILEQEKKEIKEKEKIGEGEYIVSSDKGKVKIDLNKTEKVPIEKDDIIPASLREERLQLGTLLLESPFFFIPFPLEDIFTAAIYDFDPKLPKKASPISGKAELEEDGSNLSIVLKNIIEQKDKKRKLFNLINELLPFVDDLDVEKFADKSLLFKLQEKYFKKQYLPASLISDGTINTAALILVLHFEKNKLIIIEEPERNIHPYLISKLVNIMKDASQKKQIIVTTHNPEMVKYTGLENLENILLVSRDKEGFSTIYRPSDKEKVKTFLKNEIGVEELYVKNLLEV